MKRNYIAPQTVVYQIQLGNIIASSPLVSLDTEGIVNAEEVEVKGSSGWDIWGDED